MTTVSEIIELLKNATVETTDSSSTPDYASIDFNTPYIIGSNYFIRTVSYHYVGKLIGVGTQELTLVNVSWVANSGRFNELFTKGLEDSSTSEVEVMTSPIVVLGRGALIDASLYLKDLPTKSK